MTKFREILRLDENFRVFPSPIHLNDRSWLKINVAKPGDVYIHYPVHFSVVH